MSETPPPGTSLFQYFAEETGRGRIKAGLLSIGGFFKYISLKGKTLDDTAEILFNHLVKNPDSDLLRWANKEVLKKLTDRVKKSSDEGKNNKIFKAFAYAHESSRSEKTRKALSNAGAIFFVQSSTRLANTDYINSLSILKSKLQKVIPKLSRKEIASAEERFEHAYFSTNPWGVLIQGKTVDAFEEVDWVISETLSIARYNEEIINFSFRINSYCKNYEAKEAYIKTFSRTILSKDVEFVKKKLFAVNGEIEKSGAFTILLMAKVAMSSIS
jgi:hypothetical protein